MAFVSVVLAALVPLIPESGGVVALVPAAQKAVGALEPRDAREALLKDRKFAKDRFWRRAEPVVFTWRATGEEKGPWKFELDRSGDFRNPRIEFISAHHKPDSSGRVVWELPRPNLEIDARYWWRVTSCGTVPVVSSNRMFKTENAAPRWITLEGRTENVRDLGGRRTSDGRRVRQGMIFRGQGFNDNSFDGVTVGRNRLTVEDVRYLTGTLGIRTDLDLRSTAETANMKTSPLGPSVKFVQNPSYSYSSIFTENGRRAMAANFRLFLDRMNYPVYFHCIAGADRTGALAYVLNGVLGVSRRELETDWESTFYPNLPCDTDGTCREHHFDEGFSAYGSDADDWNRRVELYLLDCGIMEQEIETFRNIMLEDTGKETEK